MTTRFVSPAGAGTQDGTSWANAAPFANMQAQHDALINGDSINLLAPATYTAPASPLNWTKRVAVRGKTSGGADAYATIVGNRSSPWPANGVWTDGTAYTAATVGADVFNYKDGAGTSGGTTLAWLVFRNVGTPIRPLFDANTSVGQVAVDHIKTHNTNGLIYVENSAEGQCSITATNCRSSGYSKGMFRAFGSILITDCHGDAQSQFHSPTTNLFGAHVQDAIAGISVGVYNFQAIRCSFRNHNAAAPAGSSKDPAVTGNYQQGDGIAVEEHTTFLPSSDIYVSGNADRGIDIKCAVPDGNLARVYAITNNFHIGVHDDLAETVVTDSWLGSTFTPSYNTSKSACVQGSGWLTAKRCHLWQDNPAAGQPASKFFIGMATGQATHVQSGVTIPDRVGKLFVRDSIRHQGTGVGLANIASIGFGTPTYTETNVVGA